MPRLALVALVALSSVASAQDLIEPSSAVKFSRTVTDGGKTFRCIATGLRKKVIVKVYAMAFCVEDPAGVEAVKGYLAGAGAAHTSKSGKALADSLANDPKFYEFLASMPAAKYMEMRFVRDVDNASVKDAYRESLNKSIGDKERVETFLKVVDQAPKNGETLVLRTEPSGDISFGLSAARKPHKDEKIASAIWLAWLGQSTVSPSLKEAVATAVAGLK